MSTKEIPYSNMHQLLVRIGFEKVPTEGKHRLYEHKESGAVVILPGGVQVIRQFHLVALRKMVVEFGIMEIEEFERLVRRIFEPTQRQVMMYKPIFHGAVAFARAIPYGLMHTIMRVFTKKL